MSAVWWIVWAAVVLVSLGVLAAIGLHLWRRVRALGHDVGRLGEVAARLSDAGGPGPAGPARVPAVLGTEATLEDARRRRRAVRAERAAGRAGRLDRATSRWRALGLVDPDAGPDGRRAQAPRTATARATRPG